MLGEGSNGVAFEAKVQAPGLWLHVPIDGAGDRSVTNVVLKTSKYAWQEGSDRSRRKAWGELAREAGTMTYLWGSMMDGDTPMFQPHMPAPVPSGLLMDTAGIQWVAMEELSESDGWKSVYSRFLSRSGAATGSQCDWDRALKTWSAIVEASVKLHVMGFQHCDLHAGNVFTRGEEEGGRVEVKFIDFGRAMPIHLGCAIPRAADTRYLFELLGGMLAGKLVGSGRDATFDVVKKGCPEKEEELGEIATEFDKNPMGGLLSTLREALPELDGLPDGAQRALQGVEDLAPQLGTEQNGFTMEDARGLYRVLGKYGFFSKP